jgi:hypothetical protein
MPGDRLERQGSTGIAADAVRFNICIDGTNPFRCGSLFSQRDIRLISIKRIASIGLCITLEQPTKEQCRRWLGAREVAFHAGPGRLSSLRIDAIM